jgi:acetyltransferase-like isoleucine patch superfamily enzyme
MSNLSENPYLGDEKYLLDLRSKIEQLYQMLRTEKRSKFNRDLPFADYFVDRWERARSLGFGEGTSIYDSSLVLGSVQVGKNTWIGPFTILDGSGGGLIIGDHCSISAGVQIYTHDTVNRTLYDKPIDLAPVKVGNRCYIGPNSVISKGVSIGDKVVIGTQSFVNRDIPSGCRAYGCPARIVKDK